MHDYDRAIEQAKNTLELDPNWPVSYNILGAAYLQKGMYDEAIRSYQKSFSLGGETADSLGNLGTIYARMGDSVRAVAILKKLSKQKSPEPRAIAKIFVALGKKDEAFDWLERGAALRDPDFPDISAEAIFDPLRSDPRFQDLLRRIGLADQSAQSTGAHSYPSQ